MELFLLNTMENKKSRKISLRFLGFFYNFLGFVLTLLEKEKEKIMEDLVLPQLYSCLSSLDTTLVQKQQKFAASSPKNNRE
jgi:hypothetical protein